MAFGNGIFNFSKKSNVADNTMDVKTLVMCGVPPAIANKAAYAPKTLTSAEINQIKQCLEKSRHTISQQIGNLDAIIQEFSDVSSSTVI